MGLVRINDNRELIKQSLALAFEEQGLSWRRAGLALVYLQDMVWREFTEPSGLEPHDYYFEVMNRAEPGELLAKRLEYADMATLRLGFFPERFDQEYSRGLKTRVAGIYAGAARQLPNGQVLSELSDHYDPSLGVLGKFWHALPAYERIALLEKEGNVIVRGDGNVN